MLSSSPYPLQDLPGRGAGTCCLKGRCWKPGEARSEPELSVMQPGREHERGELPTHRSDFISK